MTYYDSIALDEPERTLSLFILAGQSNALGRGAPESPVVAPYDPQPSSKYFFWSQSGTSGGVIDLTATHSNIVRWGPEMGLGPRLVERHYWPLIVKVAKNATSLAVDWDPAAVGDMYDVLLGQVGNAKTDAESKFSNPVEYAGIFWVQGVSDADDQAEAEAYAANLADFMSNLRTDLGAANLPIYLSLLHSGTVATYTSTVRAQQAAFVASDGNAYSIDGSDLTLRDDFHYDDAGLLALGARLADLVTT